MTEQLLHDAQIGASVEEMGRVRVSQRVGVRRNRRPPVENSADVASTEPADLALRKRAVLGRSAAGAAATIAGRPRSR